MKGFFGGSILQLKNSIFSQNGMKFGRLYTRKTKFSEIDYEKMTKVVGQNTDNMCFILLCLNN
jgi:hypothetical protein